VLVLEVLLDEGDVIIKIIITPRTVRRDTDILMTILVPE
jgi:hypothetical protein